MPTVRPFRALRYDATAVGGLSAVICPPYDVISPAERERLAARDPRNAVRVELPLSSEGGDPYRQAAQTLRAWRADGTLRRDAGPGVYVYEARFRLAGEGPDVPWRTQRGFFAVLGLEPFGAGIRPHERTFSGPREDRLRLLRATATNTSPIVVLADDRAGRMADALAAVAVTDPTAEATDEAGVRYRIWALPADDPTAALLIAGAEGGPLTVADGHHRYETALQYRAERRSEPGRAPGEVGQDDGGSPVDQVLVLVLDASPSGPRGGPLILPTHRLIRGETDLAQDLVARARTCFDLTATPPDELVTAFSPPFIEGQGARMGLLARGQAYELTPRIEATAALFPTGTPDVVRGLDVAVLEAVIAPLATAEASTAGPSVGVPVASGRVAYTHDAQEARRAVESGAFAAAWLLQPTPVSDVLRIAAAGALMPHKSTYFYPKAATGLVMFPLE